MPKINKSLIQFFILLFITTFVSVFFAQSPISSVYYLVLLAMYFKSDNESFWLAFFVTTTDGFVSFLGSYSALVSIIPGLPGIEMAQLYILIAIYKARRNKDSTKPFYSGWTRVLFLYTLILVAIGFANGLEGEAKLYFKIIKMILPMALFYTTPRLITSIDKYASFFNFIFIVFLFGFIAQLFTVFTGYSPSSNFQIEIPEEVEAGKDLRTFYNQKITLLSICGALFFLSMNRQHFFNKIYLNIIVILCFSMAFLSATRGWIISFGFMIVVYNVLINKLELKSLFYIVGLFLILFTVALSFEKVNKQIMFSFERALTLGALAKGDKTADGTLIRLDERAPIVLEAWEESPIFGVGFSNTFFKKVDPHVGNHTVLLHSGVIGFGLLLSFFLYVCNKLMKVRSTANMMNPYKKSGKLLVIVIMGWFFIHSSSGQHFAYYGIPEYIFPQALVLSLANFIIQFRA
jgi:hypothetical protein